MITQMFTLGKKEKRNVVFRRTALFFGHLKAIIWKETVKSDHKRGKNMRKTLPLMLVLVLFVFAFTGCADTKKLTLATGGTTGTYYSYGSAIATVLTDHSDLKITVASTGASMANIELLRKGDAQIAIVQNDVAYYASTGTDLFQGEEPYEDLRMIATLYSEDVHIVAAKTITDIADLRGKTVSVGDAGSGTEVNAWQVLDAYGISKEDINAVNLGFGESSEALKSGKIDAFFAVSGSPATYIANLSANYDFNLLSVDEEHYETLCNTYGFYVLETIPAQTYSNILQDTQVLAVKAVLVADKSLGAETVHTFVKALFENQKELESVHPKGALLDESTALNGVSVPLHEGALRYYEEIGEDVSMYE